MNKKELALGLLENPKWNFTNIFVSNLKDVHEMTFLGDLYGNRFTLALRMIEETSVDDIMENFENLKNNGFINYFGE